MDLNYVVKDWIHARKKTGNRQREVKVNNEVLGNIDSKCSASENRIQQLDSTEGCDDSSENVWPKSRAC